MQQFLLHNVYLHGENVAHDREAKRILGELFAAYVADEGRLPERYRRRVAADGLHRVVCDYISGMTDRYCRQQHDRHCGRRR